MAHPTNHVTPGAVLWEFVRVHILDEERHLRIAGRTPNSHQNLLAVVGPRTGVTPDAVRYFESHRAPRARIRRVEVPARMV